MSVCLSVQEARAILGADVLGPEEVAGVFGAATVPPDIPFSQGELAAARRAGEMLVLRVTRAGDSAPLTVLHMIQRFPEAFDKKLLRQMGYQLKDEWGIEREPLAATDTCAAGWALVRKAILEDSRNLTFDQQDAMIRRYAEALDQCTGGIRRRTAVEAVYDTLLYFAAREIRLLEKTWDWCASRTVDGGYLNVGGFAAAGMQILSFSTGVRHGALGVCPTRGQVE
jgi:hypothetical protein